MAEICPLEGTTQAKAPTRAKSQFCRIWCRSLCQPTEKLWIFIVTHFLDFSTFFVFSIMVSCKLMMHLNAKTPMIGNLTQHHHACRLWLQALIIRRVVGPVVMGYNQNHSANGWPFLKSHRHWHLAFHWHWHWHSRGKWWMSKSEAPVPRWQFLTLHI